VGWGAAEAMVGLRGGALAWVTCGAGALKRVLGGALAGVRGGAAMLVARMGVAGAAPGTNSSWYVTWACRSLYVSFCVCGYVCVCMCVYVNERACMCGGECICVCVCARVCRSLLLVAVEANGVAKVKGGAGSTGQSGSSYLHAHCCIWPCIYLHPAFAVHEEDTRRRAPREGTAPV
jgi:hypothetical protein